MTIKRKAFTMIELVFVIVVLGILAAVAIPKLAATRDDAYIVQGRANVLAIRSGIITERQGRMFRGDSKYAADLNSTVGNGVTLFGNVMTMPIISGSGDGKWRKTAANTFMFHVQHKDVQFDYNNTNGNFTCDRTNVTYGELCKTITD